MSDLMVEHRVKNLKLLTATSCVSNNNNNYYPVRGMLKGYGSRSVCLSIVVYIDPAKLLIAPLTKDWWRRLLLVKYKLIAFYVRHLEPHEDLGLNRYGRRDIHNVYEHSAWMHHTACTLSCGALLTLGACYCS